MARKGKEGQAGSAPDVVTSLSPEGEMHTSDTHALWP
jgi:hypothetical protein